jgi:hypothetical protein
MATFYYLYLYQTPEVIMANTTVMNSGHIRITNISENLKKQLIIIAKNNGYTFLNDYLRKELKNIVDNAPAEKKIKKEDY